MKYYRYLFLFYFIAHLMNEMIFEYLPNAKAWDPNTILYLIFLPIILAIILSIIYFLEKFSFKQYLIGLLCSILGIIVATIVALFFNYILTAEKSYYFGEQIPWLIMFLMIECVIILISTTILFPLFFWLVRKIKK